MDEKRFEIVATLELKDAPEKPGNRLEVTYHDMGEGDLVALEASLIEAIDSMDLDDELTIGLCIHELKDGTPMPFCQGTMILRDSAKTQTFVDWLRTMNDWGIQKALTGGEKLPVEERLSILGLGERVAALSAGKAG